MFPPFGLALREIYWCIGRAEDIVGAGGPRILFSLAWNALYTELGVRPGLGERRCIKCSIFGAVPDEVGLGDGDVVIDAAVKRARRSAVFSSHLL